MDDDSIGDIAAIMLEAIEEHSHEERYRKPFLAARIERVRAELEALQVHIEEEDDEDQGSPDSLGDRLLRIYVSNP